MKFNHFYIIGGIAMAGLLSFGCSKDDDVTEPDRFAPVLQDKYPGATNVDWEVKGSFHVADCDYKGQDLEVWFGPDLAWEQTVTELGRQINVLPVAVKQAFVDSSYGTDPIDDIDRYDRPSQTFYVIEVNHTEPSGVLRDVDVFINNDGTQTVSVYDTGQDITPFVNYFK